MSRSQQNQVFNQTSGESQGAFGNSENDLALANQDIGNYQSQVGQLKAENPFAMGGEYQQDQNMSLANTSDAMARAFGAQLQDQARRTGENPAGAIGATESMQQQNERDLAAQEADANNQRIAQEAGYNEGVVGDYGKIPGMETSVAGKQGDLYSTALGDQEKAAATPSFMDTMGSAFAQGLGGGAAGLLTGQSRGGINF